MFGNFISDSLYRSPVILALFLGSQEGLIRFYSYFVIVRMHVAVDQLLPKLVEGVRAVLKDFIKFLKSFLPDFGECHLSNIGLQKLEPIRQVSKMPVTVWIW